MKFATASKDALQELAERVQADLKMMDYATKPWVEPRFDESGKQILDVLIIGAGQSGLAVGHALQRRGVGNILILDSSPEGKEGVWSTFARNYEIRSPKDITGTELGLPSLSIQSFYEAKYSRQAWNEIKRIPRLEWLDYLQWYRSVVNLPIRNNAKVVDIDYDAQGVSVSLADGETLRARLVVLATGMDGGGAWRVPDSIKNSLPRERYNHSSDIFDETKLKNKNVGILGSGAAAFDIAVAALTAGASRVDMCLRGPRLPMIDIVREGETAGHLNHSHEIPDRMKWDLAGFRAGLRQSPADHHFFKACSFPNFFIHVNAGWDEIGLDGDDILVKTGEKTFRFDHVFAATGVTVDMDLRPELRKISANAALWKHRFTPPDSEGLGRLNFPYLSANYQFIEREPGIAPGIDRIFAYNALAAMSMGIAGAVSISAMKYAVPRVVSAVTGFLFKEQEDNLIDFFAGFTTPAITFPPHVRLMLGLPAEGELDAAAP
ncbi:NAD(P)/FAD-dependent oxidoreductase [Rhizobium sp. S152]|uniref:NAD(P)-binding domain-containing protein n=1 Tax=Rhizobium sp. S152 TaxID=3055038 RepID=UPI0025A98ED4|nr:NAD(P)/FAD-dependent oxidoreductase [Rhizobium sp. S152]MDM9627877.1 NAD(P)/FAD-dependent oxidoreductase [Rhizobium sp. S152]